MRHAAPSGLAPATDTAADLTQVARRLHGEHPYWSVRYDTVLQELHALALWPSATNLIASAPNEAALVAQMRDIQLRYPRTGAR